MNKLLNLINKAKDKIAALYTGGNGTIAVAVTITAIITLSVAGIIVIKAFTKDTVSAATPETYSQTTFEDETTTGEETTDETTTIEETTTPEETTAPPEITTTYEIVPETIPIENLTIVSNDVAEDFDAKKQASSDAEANETLEPPVQQETTPPKVSEVSQVVKGIDVSKWQGDIDWAKVKADGVNFVIIKAAGRSTGSDGSLYVDSKFEQNIKGALANGIQVGVYFFSQALSVQEAREEASLILSLIKDYKITYPVAFDWETCKDYRRTYNAMLSKSAMNSIASTFCDMVKAAGYTPMIYTCHQDLMGRYNREEICSKYKVWLAYYFKKYKGTGTQYSVGDPVPITDYSYQMWQYGSTGRINGINGNVDMNVGFFTYTGSQVPTSPITLVLQNTTITTNISTPVNLMDGVQAFNTAGLDVTSSVTCTIKNSAGQETDATTAFSSPGTYIVTYYIKDFTGADKAVKATLIVRSAPVISLNSLSLSYTGDTTKDMILTDLQNNILSAADYEGNDIKTSVTFECDSNLTSMFENGGLTPGTYAVTYSVSDSQSLSSSVSITLVITEPATTVDTETSSNNETTTNVPIDTTENLSDASETS